MVSEIGIEFVKEACLERQVREWVLWIRQTEWLLYAALPDSG